MKIKMIRNRFNNRSIRKFSKNLSYANLYNANFFGADLSGANLSCAYLYNANFSDANLFGANLTNTCLDPSRKPNALVSEFKKDGIFIVGYRTKESITMRNIVYESGSEYSALFFSTCENTDCHPGLYLYPTLEQVKKEYESAAYVKVWAKAEETVKAVTKWRCKKFYRVENV